MSISAIPTDRHVTYQRQWRRCGKSPCHCQRGLGHGPYWYAYWHDELTGKLRSAYVGKADVVPASSQEVASA